MKDCTFIENIANSGGGAMLTHHGCTQIENTLFKENNAAIGAGIAFSSIIGNDDCINTISSSEFIKNIGSEATGGAIHINDRYINITATNDTLKTQDWVYTSKDTMNMTGILYINGSKFRNNKAPNFGAAIGISRHWMNDDKLESKNSFFTLSTPVKYNITISNCDFTTNLLTNNDNTDEEHGGAAFGWLIEQDSVSFVALKDSTFYSHSTVSQGGAIFVTCYGCTSSYSRNLIHSLYGCQC